MVQPQETFTEGHDSTRAAGTLTSDLVNLGRGFCMGAADTVPGVSGGTVALILGHYQRLIAAISRFDTHALALLFARRWDELWRYCDLRFIIALGVGLVIGAGALASTMHWLLEHRMSQTLAVFFGLVLASGWLVATTIGRWSPLVIGGTIAGALLAFWIGGLTVIGGSENLLYLFVSAAIAICAMILPGISGAFVLLLLGMYHPVIGMIKQFVHGDIGVEVILKLSIFAAGCLVGLALFTRILRRLLSDYRDPTVGVLVGLMIGSLRRVWPLQSPTQATADLPFKERQFDTYWPSQWDGDLWVPFTLIAVSVIAVLVIERAAAGRDSMRQA